MTHEICKDGSVIRASSLPGWNDCARREAARIFADLIQAAGYSLKKRPPTVGACVGTAVHEAAHEAMKSKIETGNVGPEDACLDRAMDALSTEIEHECLWDRITGDKNTAERQIVRMVVSFRDDAAPQIEPVESERRLEADLGDGFTITGQKDILCRAKQGIRDIKTGTMQRANGGQYGAYSLIDRAHGHTIDTLSEIFIPRKSLRSEQPPPTFTGYDVAACERLARQTIDDIKRSVEDFNRRLVSGNDPSSAFRANPMSMLCGDKYCPAWGTNFCRVHKQEK